LPLHLNCGNYTRDGKEIPALSASASKDKDGAINITVVNVDPGKETELLIDLRGGEFNNVSGRVLKGEALTSHNTFEKSETVRPESMKGARIRNNMLSLYVPPASVVVLTVTK
ncbi:alpha-N-arabinofuranosidase, partial [bacterium]|nr:alpha-N-arabinofuranosidase [bacterium]